MYLTSSIFPLLSAQVRPQITDEQKPFVLRVLEIPLSQRKWKDLVIADTLLAYCGGPKPSLTAHRLNVFSHGRKF